jgi:hypothetical protein
MSNRQYPDCRLKSLAGFGLDSWDRQLEDDARSGKLDRLAEQAIRDFRQGRCTEL